MHLIIIALITVLIGSYLIYRSIRPGDERSPGQFFSGLVMMVLSVFAWAGMGGLPNNPGQGIYYSPIMIGIAIEFTSIGAWALLQSGHGALKSSA